jgi:starch synthase
VIDCPSLYDRDGGPYQDGEGENWPDNPLRFAMLSRVAALLANDGFDPGWRADVLHLNDWHTALAAAYVRQSPRPRTPVMLTVHNLAFAGVFEVDWLPRIAVPADCWSSGAVEFYGRMSFLKAGLYYADLITTGSPTYAMEIRKAPLGMGFEALLTARSEALHGILNGIDTAVWDPKRDARIAAHFAADALAGKAVNKRALQRRFALPESDEVPLFAVVSRLAHQKGVDLIAELAEWLIASPAQLAVIGTGDRASERQFRALADKHPAAIGVHVGFDESLAHLAEAGADIFLMPSRFEPCGLNQMYSQRYGTVPIVSATGGLVDSVVDCTPGTLAEGTATGFHFSPVEIEPLTAAIARALAVWRDRGAWRRLQRAGMARDFGWARAAREYADLYAQIAHNG